MGQTKKDPPFIGLGLSPLKFLSSFLMWNLNHQSWERKWELNYNEKWLLYFNNGDWHWRKLEKIFINGEAHLSCQVSVYFAKMCHLIGVPSNRDEFVIKPFSLDIALLIKKTRNQDLSLIKKHTETRFVTNK